VSRSCPPASWLFWGTIPDGYTLNMHPMMFGAWFSLVATMLNLFPIGQLDGGHISYAVLGRKSSYVTLGMIAVAMDSSYFSQLVVVHGPDDRDGHRIWPSSSGCCR
jgi:membrane-associated protease RseP (regulator of RpoE activity)